MPPSIVVCRGGVAISAWEVYAHKIHDYGIPAHKVGMPIRCTSEITALIFPQGVPKARALS
jgi:hypothetical protein